MRPLSLRRVPFGTTKATPSVTCALPSERPWKTRTRRSLRLTVLEGTTNRSVMALCDSYAIPFALLMQATAFQLGLIGALPRLISSAGQLLAPLWIARTKSYRRVLVAAALLGAAAFAAVAVVPALPPGTRVWALLVLVILGLLFLELPDPALGCWVSEQVPVRRRGRYFAARQVAASIGTIAVLVGGSLFLDSLAGKVLVGFGVLFVAAAAMRVASAFLFQRMHERPKWAFTVVQPRISSFVAGLRQSNLGRIVTFSFALHAGVFICGPYLAPYQLENLGFSYAGLLVPTVVMTVATVVGVRFWGPLSDRIGNVRVMRYGTVGISILPLMWFGVSSPTHVALINVVGGFAWAGFNLCVINYVYEISEDEDRANNVAWLALGNGLGMFIGAVMGAVMLPLLPPLMGTSYITLFVLSSLGRGLSVALLLPRVAEVRLVTGGPSRQPPSLAGPKLWRLRIPTHRGRSAIQGARRIPRRSWPKHIGQAGLGREESFGSGSGSKGRGVALDTSGGVPEVSRAPDGVGQQALTST